MYAQPLRSSSPDLYHGKYVASLFASGEQGAWYDPSDLTTMFQDAAGTTPVTAVEQPVGLMLDKSKNGVGRNGAKRVNLLRRTRQLQDTAWTKINNVTVTDNYGLAPDGTNTATRVQLVRSPSGWAEIFQRLNGSLNLKVRMWLKALAGTPTIATTYDNSASSYKNIVTLSQEWTEYEFDIATAMTGGINLIIWGDLPQTSLNADFLIWNPDVRLTSEANTLPKYQRIDADWLSTLPGNHATQTTTASRPVLSARVNLLTVTETLATQSVTTAATTQRLRFEGTGNITLSGTATGTYSAGSHTFSTTAGTLTLTVSGSVTKADLRAANDALNQPAYQRVNTATDYDTQGFPLYLRFDGVDDSLVTPSINFTSTDKMTVFAGFRKLASVTQSIVANKDIDAAGPGFALFADAGSANIVRAFSGGTISGNITSISATGLPAPLTLVSTFTGDIAADINRLRINGVLAAETFSDQGSGNHANLPLFIGTNPIGTSRRFNGRLYGLIVRGAQTDDLHLTNVERYLANKSGVLL